MRLYAKLFTNGFIFRRWRELKPVPYLTGALSFQWESLAIIPSSGAQALLEVISVISINWISQYTSRSKAIKLDISFNSVA